LPPQTYHPTIRQLGPDDPPSDQLEIVVLNNNFN
jgi:hypothetical protein